ncbi:hypothetical protein JOM56_012831, partial [Amanita muscaria]
ARLQKKWSSPVYAFFKRTPTIEYDRGSRFHVFECNTQYCKGRGKYQRLVRRNLLQLPRVRPLIFLCLPLFFLVTLPPDYYLPFWALQP